MDTDTPTGRMPCEDKGRVLEGLPDIVSKSPEARGEAWNRSFLAASEGPTLSTP